VGHRRIGLAGCDALGITVSPLPALRRGPFPRDLAALASLWQARRAQVLVIGLPLDAEQQLTPQAGHCRRYGLRLAHGLAEQGLQPLLAWVNEHASTWAAAERFALQGDRSGRLDSAAAALLLEQWLREGPPARSPASGGGAMADPEASCRQPPPRHDHRRRSDAGIR
jgi:putative Holliday junction resolvase